MIKLAALAGMPLAGVVVFLLLVISFMRVDIAALRGSRFILLSCPSGPLPVLRRFR